MASRYADQQAFERYNDFDGQEVIVSQLVPLSAANAFDLWIESSWKSPLTTEIRRGTGRGHIGHTRKLPLGIVEEIISAGIPRVQEEDKIPSILYTVREFGVIPANDHLGLVSFVPDRTAAKGKPSTLVVWAVKMTPTSFGNLFCCGGSIIRLLTRSTLSQALQRFMTDVAQH